MYQLVLNYIKWGFESRLKLIDGAILSMYDYIKWGFESRLKLGSDGNLYKSIISNGDLRVD